MLGCNDDSELRHAPELPVLAPYSSGRASIAGQAAACSGARAIADTEPTWGGYRTEIFTRRQELLSGIASQYSRSALSAEEQDYLSRMSSMISSLNLESIASIDVLKLCVVCARFYPRINIRQALTLLKSGIEAFVRAEAL